MMENNNTISKDHTMNWISIKEGIPEEGQDCLVVCDLTPHASFKDKAEPYILNAVYGIPIDAKSDILAFFESRRKNKKEKKLREYEWNRWAFASPFHLIERTQDRALCGSVLYWAPRPSLPSRYDEVNPRSHSDDEDGE